MNKKLFTQIKNEWRTNLWLIIELLVVSVVLWYIVDFFYTKISVRTLPRGFNTEHCYRIDFNYVNIKSPEFNPDINDSINAVHMRELLDRISRRPEVEAASLSQNSYPYNGSNSGIWVYYADDRDTLQNDGYVVRRWVTPDFVRVFRYTGAAGETSEQLAEMLKENKILINNDLFMYRGVELKDYAGKKFALDDTTMIHTLGAAITTPRYSDYQTWGSTVLINVLNDRQVGWCGELCIRVKPDMDHDVIENIMKDAPSQYRIGNLMVTDVVSFDDIRDNFQRLWSNQERNYYAGMGFLLFNIFLGLLGTFWFRTQQRVSEIAIRKANGATSTDIFRRLISEGLLLLVVATIPATLIDIGLSWYGYNQWFDDGYMGWVRTPATILISFALMALMIVLGILIPARRAMKIKPAVALKDE
ncbi:MAG: ABC transporter permease [Paramuribaculum sp.]|nr:ABC transporter permease [Paramuribaculum sp.]MDE7152312.1 ABC transporter permease [Candidatus Amulumruptor sp.]